MRYVIGIDGGGTSCRAAVASSDGVVLGQARSGSANIRTDLDGAHRNIVGAVAEAAEKAGVAFAALKDSVAVLGLAGGNVGDYAARLKALLPFRESVIVNDGIIALHGALGSHDGVIAIVGTGSVFVARTGGAIRMIGGWGFQVGDLGGGARLGRQLLEEVLLAHDGVRPKSRLTERVMATFEGDPRRIVDQVRDATPGLYGSYAPLIVTAAEEGDAVATEILDAGRRDVERMLDAIMTPETDRICLLGGLAATYARLVDPGYRARLKAPLGDALQGAVALAARRSAEQEGASHG
ncbi:MAG: BadF/BadG/BcrA/BcrD ATPase family protein [Pararhizobium sp.]